MEAVVVGGDSPRRGAAEPDVDGVAAPLLIGREGELARLEQVLTDTSALVLVEGEAGVGKSRLLEEFLASPAGGVHCALTAVCPPVREPYTLGPIVEALLATDVGTVAGLGLSSLAGALRPLFPEWAEHLPPTPEPAGDASAARHRVLRALAELLDRLGVGLLVVDDAQWSDDATREFLLFLAERHGQGPSLVVAYRPEDLVGDPWLLRLSGRLRPHRARLRVVLDPLDEPGTAALASSMLANQEVSGEFAQHLHARTEGVPLAVEECVRLMARRGDLVRRGQGWKRLPLDEIVVPPTVRDTVLEHAGRLDGATRAVLRAAAVVADPIAEHLLARISELPPAEFAAGLAEAVARRLLHRRDHHRVSFRHVLAGRAIYDAMDERDRRTLHERAGRVLETVTPRPLAQLARHFRQVGDGERWGRYAELSADVALQTGDETTAGALLHDVLTNGDVPAEQMCALVEKVPFGSFTGPCRLRDLAAAVRRVLDVGVPDPGVEANLRFQLARILNDMEEFDEAHAELERALPHLDRRRASPAVAMMLLGWPRGRSPAARHLTWLDRAAEFARSLEPSDRLRVAAGRAPALLQLGDERGWAEAAQIPQTARTVRDRRIITVGYLNIGDGAMRWGRYAEADGWLATARRLAVEYEQVRIRELVDSTRLHLDWFTGAWNGLAERAATMADTDDLHPVSRVEPIMIIGLLRMAAGDLVQAAREIERAVAGARDAGAWDTVAEAVATLVQIRLREGRPDAALTLSRDPCEVVAEKGVWLWGTDVVPARVQALLAVGATAQAQDLVDAFARGLPAGRLPAPRAAVLDCRGLLAEAAGDHASAAVLFGRAAAAWAALPRPYGAALSRERQAGCLIRAGAVPEGLDLLADVLDGLSSLPASLDVDRVARTLRAHGRQVPRVWRGGRKGYGPDLSPREREVVALAAEGRTNREIADALHRSHHTVASQMKSAMRKFGVSSRAALTARAIGAGLVAEPGTGAGE
ncbi:AAA family ATPase [Micromonospora sp. CPM1]|uniref:helix-turn-helix transcriptional regulator n=1 Tax=Micromonospora sp. CPM1 TaxID=2944809 RepID=UPI0014323268|nr:AAA family ATPase [Micromonospora sp. CPM1]MCO1613174.1 AAA family ATPase [Micromonospora sp. CPM1]